MIAIDGEATKLHEGTVMTIRRAPYEAKMVVRGDITYFQYPTRKTDVGG